MSIEQQNDEIIRQLITLNASIKKQTTVTHIAGTGIIYGIGFFVGSAIIATIALGILGPIIGKISWIGENFSKGSLILQTK